MKKMSALLTTVLGAFVASTIVPAQPAKEDSQTMERNEHEYGKPNPNAPQELSQFAFLVGKWRGEAKLKREDGTRENLKALWEGRG